MVPLISWLQDGLTSFEPCSLFVVISLLKAPFRQKKKKKREIRSFFTKQKYRGLKERERTVAAKRLCTVLRLRKSVKIETVTYRNYFINKLCFYLKDNIIFTYACACTISKCVLSVTILPMGRVVQSWVNITKGCEI